MNTNNFTKSLLEALSNHESNTLTEYVEKFTDLTDFLNKSNDETLLENTIYQLTAKLDPYYADALDRDPEAFYLGKLSEKIDRVEHESRIEKKTKEEKCLFEACKKDKLDKKRQILELIYKQDNINHNELAEKAGLTKSSLSNYICDISKTQFITSNKIGKYKYYNITESGAEYINSCERKTKQNGNKAPNIKHSVAIGIPDIDWSALTPECSYTYRKVKSKNDLYRVYCAKIIEADKLQKRGGTAYVYSVRN